MITNSKRLSPASEQKGNLAELVLKICSRNTAVLSRMIRRHSLIMSPNCRRNGKPHAGAMVSWQTPAALWRQYLGNGCPAAHAGAARLPVCNRSTLSGDYDGTNHPHKWNDCAEVKRRKNKDWSDKYTDVDSPVLGEALYDSFVRVAMQFAITPDAAWYCRHASRKQSLLENVWEKNGAFVHQQIIWVKDRPILTRSWYMWQHDPCFFGWAAQTPSVQRRRTLVAWVRRFALALHAENPRHEVPPQDCVGHAKAARRRPYIYTADDIDRIVRAARQMPTKDFIGPETLTTLLGLLASTGLRISEALSLQCSDIGDNGLLIRKSKYGKSRLIPLHETTQAALGRYLSERARRPVYTQAVFVSSNGQALLYATVREKFRRLLVCAGLRPESSSSGPRLHDLRHTFSVRSLEQCQPDRQAAAQHMVALSTYLGHTNVTNTYWYLEATPPS